MKTLKFRLIIPSPGAPATNFPLSPPVSRMRSASIVVSRVEKNTVFTEMSLVSWNSDDYTINVSNSSLQFLSLRTKYDG